MQHKDNTNKFSELDMSVTDIRFSVLLRIPPYVLHKKINKCLLHYNGSTKIMQICEILFMSRNIFILSDVLVLKLCKIRYKIQAWAPIQHFILTFKSTVFPRQHVFMGFLWLLQKEKRCVFYAIS